MQSVHTLSISKRFAATGLLGSKCCHSPLQRLPMLQAAPVRSCLRLNTHRTPLKSGSCGSRSRRCFVRAAPDAAPTNPSAAAALTEAARPSPFQRLQQFLVSISPKVESVHLLQDALSLLRRYGWALLLLFLARDALQFLLHRVTHRLTNMAAEAVFEYPISSTAINPWWLVLDAQFLEQYSGYQLMMVLFFLIALPLNLLLNCGSTAIMMLLCTKESRAAAQAAAAGAVSADSEANSLSSEHTGSASPSSSDDRGTSPTSNPPSTSTPDAPSTNSSISSKLNPQTPSNPTPQIPPDPAPNPSTPNPPTAGPIPPQTPDSTVPPLTLTSAGVPPSSPLPDSALVDGTSSAAPANTNGSATPTPTSTSGRENGNGGTSVGSSSGPGAATVPIPSVSPNGKKSQSLTGALESTSGSEAVTTNGAGGSSATPGSAEQKTNGAVVSTSGQTPSPPTPAVSPSPIVSAKSRPIKGPKQALEEIKSVLPDLWPMLGRIWWVELLTSGASLGLQGLMTLIIPVVWALPWLLSIQLAVATAVLKGNKGLDALRESHQLMKGYRAAYFWPFLALLLAVRLVDTLRAGSFALMPSRYWTDAIEIPIAVYLLIGLLRFLVSRLQDLLPLAAFLRVEGRQQPQAEDGGAGHKNTAAAPA